MLQPNNRLHHAWRWTQNQSSKFTVDLSPNITRYGIDFWNRISLKFRINAVLTAGMVYKRPRKSKEDEGKTPPPMINDPSEEKKMQAYAQAGAGANPHSADRFNGKFSGASPFNRFPISLT